MDAVMNFLTTVEGTEIMLNALGSLGIIGAALVSFFWVRKSSKDEAQRARRARILEIAKGAVRQVHASMVAEWKEASKNGKLSREQRDAALKAGMTAFIAWCRDEGIDVIKEVGRDAVPALIEKALGMVKARQ